MREWHIRGGTVGAGINEQSAMRGDPVFRVAYYRLDCTRSQARTRTMGFIDTGEIGTANGLDFRHVCASGSFEPKDQDQ